MRNKRETEFFLIVKGWTLIWSTKLLLNNMLRNILRSVFDGPYGVHDTRDYRRMVVRRYLLPSLSNKDIRTDAETVPERLHVRRG
jgi:hypothetical protein